MNSLHSKIMSDARIIGTSIIKVDNFLNHQVDCGLMKEIAEQFKERFKDQRIDKVLTAEVSGIAIGAIVALELGVPLLFARKVVSQNLDENTYEAKVHSYTKNIDYTFRVSKNYLLPGENVLIVDDFLANGQAIEGLASIVKQAGAKLVGAGIVIEKGFQSGGTELRSQGIRVESLAIVDRIENGKPVLR